MGAKTAPHIVTKGAQSFITFGSVPGCQRGAYQRAAAERWEVEDWTFDRLAFGTSLAGAVQYYKTRQQHYRNHRISHALHTLAQREGWRILQIGCFALSFLNRSLSIASNIGRLFQPREALGGT